MTPRGCNYPALPLDRRSVLRGQTTRRRRSPGPGVRPVRAPRRRRSPQLRLISRWLLCDEPLHLCNELARLVDPRPDLGFLKFDEVRVVTFVAVVEEPVVQTA